VSSPGSCIRCSRPLEVESATGLCTECLRTVHSPVSTPRELVRPPINPYAPTLDEAPTPAPGSGEETCTHQAGAEPPTVAARRPDRVPLPPAPAGYEILGELGLGGMGAVFLAREVVPDRLVAMKFLRRPGSQTAYDRFLVEVRALAALDHRNIIRVLSTDFFRSDPFFTTEYFPSGSLLKKLEEEGPLDPYEAARLMALAARAVHAANQKDVIHRDLKPSNILLTADGVPKVADFGLAKRLDQDDDLTTSTGALGSPPYMAPEQTGQGGLQAVDARTDVYGLGATLYHLVTGRRPFMGDTPEAVMAQVLIDPPEPPRSVRSEVPRELEAIVLKCLEKEPARRYQTGAALADDLDRFLAGRPPEAPLLTWPRRVRQWMRRFRKQLAAGGGLAALLVGVFVLGAILWPRPKLNDPPDPLERIRTKLLAGERVELIGETGEPAWYRWRVSPSQFGPAPDAPPGGVGAATFHQNLPCLLELLPEVAIPHYRLTAHIRQVNGNGTDAPRVGLFVGLASHAVRADRTMHTMLCARFLDLAPSGKLAPLDDGAVMIVQGGEYIGMPVWVSNKTVRFPADETWGGSWRKLSVEVTENRVEFSWAPGPQAPSVPVLTRTTEEADQLLGGLRKKMIDYAPGADPSPPQWLPGGPLGIFCYRSTISVKNVTIEPLP
jgi:eukaryotic-like serine/threonine-protein kinase